MENESGIVLDALIKLIAPKFMEALKPQLVDLIKETVADEVERQLDNLDMASLISDNIDTDEIASEVSRNLDFSDIASEVMDQLDMGEIAEQVKGELDLDLEDEIKDVLGGLELKVVVA